MTSPTQKGSQKNQKRTRCPHCGQTCAKIDRKTADKRLHFVCDKCGNWWTEGKGEREEALKACPFCGSADCRVIGGPGTRGGPKYWAGCDHCSGRAWGDTEAEAIATWNRRHSSKAEGEMREALEACRALILRDYSDARASALEGHPIARDARTEWTKVCNALALLHHEVGK